MPAPQYGALGTSFTIVRVLQAVSLIGIIGMTANFISEMVSVEATPPNVLVGTLSVTCIAVLYCAITYILYYDGILPFLLNVAMDGLLLIAVVIVAVTVGKPLSYLDCRIISKTAHQASSALDAVSGLGSNLNKVGAKIDYNHWLGADRVTCYEMKSIWGLSIALCILFAFSMLLSVCLWRRAKSVPPKGGDY